MRFFCVLWLWIFLSEFKTSTTHREFKGRNIIITCTQSLASTNIKYFCRDPCKDPTDVLVKSDQSQTGRYKLKDFGNSTFTVAITDLQDSDSGIYWCGVERFGLDTFNEVTLTVSKGFVNVTGPTDQQTIFGVPVFYIVYGGAGLATFIIICTAGLITVCQCRKKVKRSRCVTGSSIYNGDEEASGVYENAPDDRAYAIINKSSDRSKNKRESDPIYQNIHFDTSEGDALYGNLY